MLQLLSYQISDHSQVSGNSLQAATAALALKRWTRYIHHLSVSFDKHVEDHVCTAKLGKCWISIMWQQPNGTPSVTRTTAKSREIPRELFPAPSPFHHLARTLSQRRLGTAALSHPGCSAYCASLLGHTHKHCCQSISLCEYSAAAARHTRPTAASWHHRLNIQQQPFLVACHCTIFIINLLFCYVLGI